MYTLNHIDSFQITDPRNTYIYEIIPVAGGLASISSDNALRFLDPLALNGSPINVVKRVNEGVTCLRELGEGVVVTAGSDGWVRLVDLRSGRKVGEVKSGELSAFV